MVTYIINKQKKRHLNHNFLYMFIYRGNFFEFELYAQPTEVFTNLVNKKLIANVRR